MTRENLHVAMSAEQYHQYVSSATGPWDELLIRRFREEYSPSPRGRVVIDVGTGTAVLPIMLAEMPQFADAVFIGTDLFADMVEAAERAIRQRGLENRVHAVECDIHKLPFDNDYADYVISRSTIHHWADPVQAFREIYRVLQPGGLAMMHEPRRDPDSRALEDFNARRRAANFEPNDLREKYTAAEVTEFLKQAGVGDCSHIYAPETGPASMGFEVQIRKPGVRA
jgi:ubiquinone/menaquinone biosynthesis C-methylase UbiE